MADLIPPRRHSRIQLRERYPGIGQGVEPNALKSLWSDPDDHEGLAIDVDDGSQDAGIAVESSPPESAAKGWDTLPARPSSSLHAKPQVVSQATPSGRSSLRSSLSCSTLNMLISNK
jgi:hypothetical protein